MDAVSTLTAASSRWGWTHGYVPTDQVHFQVLLVAGGNVGAEKLSSTEILVTLAGEWRTVGRLPSAVDGLRGATLDNTVYMTGE